MYVTHTHTHTHSLSLSLSLSLFHAGLAHNLFLPLLVQIVCCARSPFSFNFALLHRRAPPLTLKSFPRVKCASLRLQRPLFTMTYVVDILLCVKFQQNREKKEIQI